MDRTSYFSNTYTESKGETEGGREPATPWGGAAPPPTAPWGGVGPSWLRNRRPFGLVKSGQACETCVFLFFLLYASRLVVLSSRFLLAWLLRHCLWLGFSVLVFFGVLFLFSSPNLVVSIFQVCIPVFVDLERGGRFDLC